MVTLGAVSPEFVGRTGELLGIMKDPLVLGKPRKTRIDEVLYGVCIFQTDIKKHIPGGVMSVATAKALNLEWPSVCPAYEPSKFD